MIVETVIKAVDIEKVVRLVYSTHHEAIELLVTPAGATILPGGGLRENGDFAIAYDDGKDCCTIELGPAWYEESAEISAEAFNHLEGAKDTKENKVIG